MGYEVYPTKHRQQLYSQEIKEKQHETNKMAVFTANNKNP